jgi:acetylornithine deacetylase/succinyl-diaminopimelate desuccinylase-like protein
LTPEEIKRRRHRNERIVATLLVLVLAAGTFAVFQKRQTLDEQVRRDRRYVPLHIQFSPELTLLQEYLRLDTSNPPGHELPAAQWLSGILSSHGVKAEIIETAPGRANVYARVKGRSGGEGLLLTHHMDVVPAATDGWTRPPFDAEIYFNELYGRGAIDMKGTGVCFLRAFLDVATSGRTPEHDIVFLAVADEEGGGGLGMQWLLANRTDIFDGVRYALNEGGITEMMEEKITFYGVEIGTKQVVTLLLTAETRQQLQRARIALEPWFVSREAARVMPEVKRWMRELAPHRVEFKEELEDIDRAIARGDFWALPIGYREMAQNGVWAESVVEANNGFEMRVQLLNLPDEDADARIAWLRTHVAPYGVAIGQIIRKEGATPLSQVDTRLYKLIEEEARIAYSAPTGTEVLNRWQNDSRYLRRHGIVAYGISPFPVTYFQSLTIHAANERVRTDYFNRGVAFVRRLVKRYAFPE